MLVSSCFAEKPGVKAKKEHVPDPHQEPFQIAGRKESVITNKRKVASTRYIDGCSNNKVTKKYRKL